LKGGDRYFVWKDVLLQVMIALMPVFIFQMWFNRLERSRGIPMFLGGFCLVAMLLGMLVSVEDIEEYHTGFHMVPLLLGALYGGFPVAVAITVSNLAVLAVLISDYWDYLRFIGMLFVATPLILIATPRFKYKEKADKLKLVTALGSVLLIIYQGLHSIKVVQSGIVRDDQYIGLLLLSCIGFLLLIWISVGLIESVIEKQQLQYQLRHMSTNYRNEVQKLQQFIDMIPMGVVIVDARGIVTHLNDLALEAVSGNRNAREPSELISQPIAQLSDTFLEEPPGKLLSNALDGGEAASQVVEIGSRTYIITGFSVRDLQSQEIIGATLLSHDITEISQLRDEFGRMERLSLVGQMAASITHEIRNPMAVIRGFIQLMKERSPEHQREYFRIVMEELDRANAIISDFLSLAQNRVVHKEKTSLNDIVNELVQLLWADANLRGQTIEVELDERLPLLELNDKEIKQLILNLARNAMEAMGNDGLLSLRTRTRPNMVQLMVADNGCGIPREKMERLFEPFYTTKTRGTGLGLPLCLSIVERHQGQIDVTSQEGEGTTFTVSFQVS